MIEQTTSTQIVATATPFDVFRDAVEMRNGPSKTHGIYHITNCPGPNHKRGDLEPSLHFWETIGDDGSASIAMKCHSGDCQRPEIVKALGLSLRHIPGTYRSTTLREPDVTLFDLERHTLIDWRFLANLGCEDAVFTYHSPEGRTYKMRGVKVPYFNEDGTLHSRCRLRVGLKKSADERKHPRFRWNEGDTPVIAYGLQHLQQARDAGYVAIVEGESDTWTCSLHGIPALGIPGGNNVKKTLDGSLLSGIDKVYIFQELTDQTGINFPYAVQVHLRETGYTGDILRVPLKHLTEAKDLNELHQQTFREAGSFALSKDAFLTTVQEVLAQAQPMDTDTGELTIDLTPIEQALDAHDAEALIKCSSLIAQLSTQDYALLKIRIKREMGKDISIRDLDRAITEKRKKSQGNDHKQGYSKTDEGMTVPGKEGGDILISNFTAEILEDITTDDGAEQTRGYLIEAEMFGRQTTFEVTAKEFAVCNWVDEHLGAKAVITTGQSMKSHLVNAIKSISSPVVASHYAHTGWRKVDGCMVYLHAGGLLSQVSQVTNFSDSHLTHHSENTEAACKANLESIKSSVSQVSQVSQVNSIVTLSGSLLNYQFPQYRGDIREAVRASLNFLTLVKDAIGMPLYCSLWRSPLGEINYGVHVAGQTGWGKTELVSLLQRHFGDQMDAAHIPGSWSSTANSLEMLLFQAKDTVVVVDDFKPVGGKVDQARLHATADKVFRQVGNNSGRGRLTSNLEQRAERRPRCMLISTGEDIPRGQSLKARGVVVLMNEKITHGDASKRLLAAQKDARSGLYASAMAAYIEWLAPQIENIQAQLQDEIEEQREALTIEGHARAGTNTANMLIGLKYFLTFARECGAISREDEQCYLTRCIAALKQVADDAAKDNHHDKPSEQWRRLVMAALANKSAHLATPDGKSPGVEYGWICTTRTLADGTEEETLRGGGSQIGWIHEGDIYLLPTLAYKVACAMGNATGDDITTLEPTLRKFLSQDGLLASNALSSPRKTLTVRRRLENVQRDVLHIKSETLYPILDSLDSLDSAPHEVALQAGREVSQVLDSEKEDLTHLTQADDTEVVCMVGQFKQMYSKKERVMWIAPGTDIPNASISPALWYENFKKCWKSDDAKIRDAAIEALRVKIDTAIVRA